MKPEVMPYDDLSLSKKEQVALMFDRIAFRYDLMNRLGIRQHAEAGS